MTNIRTRPSAIHSGQRGAAALIVVMLLFFVVSLVAAYTNRNLIFEQRTSANQYRSTQALEAADAGLQWALGLLNSGRIDDSCAASTNLANTTFRQRYLTINPTNGSITPKLQSDGVSPLLPSCVFDGTAWQCSCPVDGTPAIAAPVGTAVFPAFRARFTAHPTRPDVVQVQVNGCTRYDDSCLNFPAVGSDSEARVTVSALFSLKGALNTVPVAPLTARGSVALTGGPLTLANSGSNASGITVNAGLIVDTDPAHLTLITAPGSPPALSVRDNDTTLSALTADRMFTNTFGLWRDTYRDQPGAVVLPCGGACTAAQVRTAAAENPGRIIWLAGNLSIDSAGDIGSALEPVMLVATGNVSFSASANIYGAVYTQAATWNSSGASQIEGAMIAEGNVDGSSTATLIYNADILTRVRTTIGSFAIVPGSWRDF